MWVRDVPELESPLITVVPVGTPLIIKAVYGPWALVEWITADGIQQGWVPYAWVTVYEPVPPGIITPTATP